MMANTKTIPATTILIHTGEERPVQHGVTMRDKGFISCPYCYWETVIDENYTHTCAACGGLFTLPWRRAGR